MSTRCSCCSTETHFQCSRCKFVKYCTEKCQREDWVNHKHTCLPIAEPLNSKFCEEELNKTKQTSGRCCGCLSDTEFKCSQCLCVHYCSKSCQKSDWADHKTICCSINSLTSKLDDQPTMFASHISPSNHAKLVKLVGERCEVRCRIDSILSGSLWDTGAMVSVVSRKWFNENIWDAELRDVRELLDEPLELRTANKKSLPYIGWLNYPLNCQIVVAFVCHFWWLTVTLVVRS